MTSQDAAQQAVQTAPSVAKAEAAARRAEAAASQAMVAVYPRLELEARYTRVSPIPALNLGLSDDQLFNQVAIAQDIQTRLGNLESATGTMRPPLDLRDVPASSTPTSLRFQENQGLFQARLTYPVSAVFLTVLPRHESALKLAESQKLTRHVEEQTVGLRAREVYYNYARARAGLMVAKSSLAQAEAHRKDSEALVAAGSIARVELMRAEAQVASARVSVARADNQVATARAALFTLLHVQGSDDITINEDIEAELPALAEDESALYAKALDRRTEIKVLRTLSEAQEHSVDAFQGQNWPVLAVGAQADYANPNQRWFGHSYEWRPSWAAFASLVWSPNDTAGASKQVDQARAELAQTRADLQSLEDALRVEVNQAYNGFVTAHTALDAARSGIAASEESYRVRHEQFRAGAAIAVDVVDARTQLTLARLELVNALIDMRIAKARLDRAIEAN